MQDEGDLENADVVFDESELTDLVDETVHT